MTAQSILNLPFSPPSQRLYYGTPKHQFGDLRLPSKPGPHPVLVIIHGGCWLSKIGDLNFMAPFAEVLTKRGFATWNIEYRGIDVPGGGWPGTFQDIGNGIDYLKEIAPRYNLNLDNLIVIGHSVGGHLALWAAARHQLTPDSILYIKEPLPVKLAINMAGPTVLKSFEKCDQKACDEPVVKRLVGNTHYEEACPSYLFPLKVKQILLSGEHDELIPSYLAEQYVSKAQELKDNAKHIKISGTGHYEFIAPGTKAYQIVIKEIEDFLVKRPPYENHRY